MNFFKLSKIRPTANDIAQGQIKYSDLSISRLGALWVETRPFEKGRSVLVLKIKDDLFELNPRGSSVRSRVYEYGGKAYAVSGSTVVYHLDSKGIYQHLMKGKAHKRRCLINSLDNASFGDIDFVENELLVAVKEIAHKRYVSLVVYDFKTSNITEIYYKDRLLACGRINPNLTTIAFISWPETNMVWDNSRIYLADVKRDEKKVVVENIRPLLKFNFRYSVTQLKWIDEHRLCFLSDMDGYYNLYQYDLDKKVLSKISNLKFDCCNPQWIFGQSNYITLGNDCFLITFKKVTPRQNSWKLGLIQRNKFYELNTGFQTITSLSVAHSEVGFLASSDTHQFLPIIFKKNQLGDVVNLRTRYLIKPSKKKAIEFKKVSFESEGCLISAFYYPARVRFSKKSPVIIFCHGGPTSSVEPGYDPIIEFFISRGFNVATFDYRGSSGYGREFRELLKGTWGLYDVEDAINLAKFLLRKKLAATNKIYIRGSSAGGLTVFGALANSDLFALGVSYYGVTDLIKLNETTHRFEESYLTWLIGSYPKHIKRYIMRSPINFVEKISVPMLLIQGQKDKIVPISQATSIYERLNRDQKKAKLVVFKQEGHGFRTKDAISRSLSEELRFYLENKAFD